MVRKHLAGEPVAPRLQQSDGRRRRRGGRNVAGDLAYVTTETGAVTMIIMVLLAG